MKNLIKNFAFCAVIIAFASCQNEDNDLQKVELSNNPNQIVAASSAGECDGIHFDYSTGHDGPANWKNLCPGWSDCGGTSQSPVDISTVYINTSLEAIEFEYNATSTNIVNNGHTVKFSVDAGSSISVNGKQYNLLQFHYHGLSEHQISGQHYPLEVHFVHQAADKSLAVVGAFFMEGQENELFATYLEHFPHHEGTYSSSNLIELVNLIPLTDNYYTYSGSLTTPPCSEIVTWLVMEEPFEASAAQIQEFSEILHNNFRPVQPLNGRYVYAYIDSKK